MSSMVMPVLLSLCFALAFLIFSYMQETQVSAQIFEAAGARFLNSPWRQHPKSTIYDVRGGRQVYQWLEQVLLEQLYMETPEDGSHEAYCTKSHPCRLGEGNANSDSECSGPLIAGRRNCPSRLGSRRDCCQQCVGETCQEQIVPTKEVNLTTNTSVPDLSANCADTLPPWLSLFARWLLGHQEGGHCAPSWLNGGALQPSTDGTNLIETAEADTTSFGVYNYGKGGGFNRAGAFVEILDFDKPKKVTARQISELKRAGWFDLNQGSMVVELMLWNGNVELLTHIAFVFEHQFSGKTNVQVRVSSLAFNIHDFSLVSSYVRIFTYIVIIICFVFFFRSQVEDVSADYRLYFSEPMGYIHLATILLCAYVIVCPGYCSDFPLHARVVIPAPLPQLKGSIKRHIVKTC
ncbi:Uncharacterized protein SCF082_LOCUS27007 [Durusdinium trenchii]|uniref:Polycystin domain-containing protein n=1 Tax=Durusdinium trenchii TaxID=1381693 RepID=A0ABP0MCP8_9DINO